jgi:hypothetical protein
VTVPRSKTQWHAPVEFATIRRIRRGVHHADEFERRSRALEDQRCRMHRVELPEPCLERVFAAGVMLDRQRDVRQKLAEAAASAASTVGYSAITRLAAATIASARARSPGCCGWRIVICIWPCCIVGIAESVARATLAHGNAGASRVARQSVTVRTFIDERIPKRMRPFTTRRGAS